MAILKTLKQKGEVAYIGGKASISERTTKLLLGEGGSRRLVEPNHQIVLIFSKVGSKTVSYKVVSSLPNRVVS
jgi:hypothetical protein